MNKLITVNEKALLDAFGMPSVEPASPMLTSAEKTAAWLIDEIARGRNPSAADTRSLFEMHWQPAVSAQDGELSAQDYTAQLLQIPHACWRIREVIWSREILQPMLPYKLTINGITITGEYAILRSSRRKRHAYVLYLRDAGVRRRPLVPDVLSCARWLDLHDRWAGVSNQWKVSSAGVLHYWVTTDFAAEHKPDIESARQALADSLALWRQPDETAARLGKQRRSDRGTTAACPRTGHTGTDCDAGRPKAEKR